MSIVAIKQILAFFLLKIYMFDWDEFTWITLSIEHKKVFKSYFH